MRPGQGDECQFCEIVNRRDDEARVLMRDDATMAFFPSQPAVLGHTLVIPTNHVPRLWLLGNSDAARIAETVLAVAQTIEAALKPDGMNLIQSNGETRLDESGRPNQTTARRRRMTRWMCSRQRIANCILARLPNTRGRTLSGREDRTPQSTKTKRRAGTCSSSSDSPLLLAPGPCRTATPSCRKVRARSAPRPRTAHDRLVPPEGISYRATRRVVSRKLPPVQGERHAGQSPRQVLPLQRAGTSPLRSPTRQPCGSRLLELGRCSALGLHACRTRRLRHLRHLVPCQTCCHTRVVPDG